MAPPSNEPLLYAPSRDSNNDDDDEDDDDDEPPLLVSVEATTSPPVEESNPVVDKNRNNIQHNFSGETPTPLPPCPVTILSGFLGSGKTTLIQYILSNPNHGKRIAIIENEFGGGTDGLTIESMIARDGMDPNNKSSLQDLIELPNGCICCTVKDNLVATLEQLVTYRRQDLDYILIEASGMANPGPIASVFWLDDALDSRLRLDGIVTLVDSYHILRQLEETEEASQQIAYADRVLINKIDLLVDGASKVRNDGVHGNKPNPDDYIMNQSLENVVNTIRRIHPTAPIQTTTYSQVPDLDWILDAKCFGGIERVQELDKQLLLAEQQQRQQQQQHQQPQLLGSDNSTGHHHHHHHHDHDNPESCQQCQQQQKAYTHKHTNAVSTISLYEKGSVDYSKINAWLATILWPNQDAPNRVLRALLEHPDEVEQRQQHDDDEIRRHLSLSASSSSSQQDIFRSKGILSLVYHEDNNTVESLTNDEDVNSTTTTYRTSDGLDTRRYILQAVHDLWEIYPAKDDLQWQETEERVCKIVLIGRNLHEEELKQGFRNCFFVEP